MPPTARRQSPPDRPRKTTKVETIQTHTSHHMKPAKDFSFLESFPSYFISVIITVKIANSFSGNKSRSVTHGQPATNPLPPLKNNPKYPLTLQSSASNLLTIYNPLNFPPASQAPVCEVDIRQSQSSQIKSIRTTRTLMYQKIRVYISEVENEYTALNFCRENTPQPKPGWLGRYQTIFITRYLHLRQ